MLSRSIHLPRSITSHHFYNDVLCKTTGRRFRSDNAGVTAGSKPPLELPSMARLPTKLVLRSLVLTSLMSSKIFMKPALALLNVLSTSKSALLNPDRNRALDRILRWTVYNHFCAGTNSQEVSRTLAEIKKIGYQGVILGYSKEIVVDPNEELTYDKSGSTAYSDKCHQMVEDWKTGTLETLRMIDSGDILAVK